MYRRLKSTVVVCMLWTEYLVTYGVQFTYIVVILVFSSMRIPTTYIVGILMLHAHGRALYLKQA